MGHDEQALGIPPAARDRFQERGIELVRPGNVEGRHLVERAGARIDRAAQHRDLEREVPGADRRGGEREGPRPRDGPDIAGVLAHEGGDERLPRFQVRLHLRDGGRPRVHKLGILRERRLDPFGERRTGVAQVVDPRPQLGDGRGVVLVLGCRHDIDEQAVERADLLLCVLFPAYEIRELGVAHRRARAASGQRALNAAPARRLGQAERLGREAGPGLGVARGPVKRRQQADSGLEDVAQAQIARRLRHLLVRRLPRPRQQDRNGLGEGCAGGLVIARGGERHGQHRARLGRVVVLSPQQARVPVHRSSRELGGLLRPADPEQAEGPAEIVPEGAFQEAGIGRQRRADRLVLGERLPPAPLRQQALGQPPPRPQAVVCVGRRADGVVDLQGRAGQGLDLLMAPLLGDRREQIRKRHCRVGGIAASAIQTQTQRGACLKLGLDRVAPPQEVSREFAEAGFVQETKIGAWVIVESIDVLLDQLDGRLVERCSLHVLATEIEQNGLGKENI